MGFDGDGDAAPAFGRRGTGAYCTAAGTGGAAIQCAAVQNSGVKDITLGNRSANAVLLGEHSLKENLYMARKLLFLLVLVLMLAPATAGSAQPSGLPVDVPREELFVVDQIYRFSAGIGNYNLWSNGDQPHRHALMMETLWLRDMETGELIMDAAASGPQYNEDFTQMNVDLRDNIYWSDGEQFNADDLVFTVETIQAHPEMPASGGWAAQLDQYLDSVEKTGDFSVQFNLKEPNPRFHTLFEARWNGIYMMPQHVFETVDNPVEFRFENPVVLGGYVPTQFDPNGYWELFERRDDWERTPAAQIVNNPGPKYVLLIFYGDSAKKAIAMSRGELDVYF